MSVYQHPRLGKLIKDQPVLKFKLLPIDYQRAIIHYMSVDGAAWAVDKWEDWKWGEGKPNTPRLRAAALADIEKFLPRFIKSWGNVQFGCCRMTPASLIESINGDKEFIPTTQTSHGHTIIFPPRRIKYTVATMGWCASSSEYDHPTWPVILSDFDDETLQDGWTRFKHYCQRNWSVPVTWYVK